MKRLFSLLLTIILALGISPAVFAASEGEVKAADTLYEMGLFSGTGTDAAGRPIYDLDRTPTRHEAVTMLVGLLGKKEEALNGTWEIPFTDVADWARPFVGYAYANGLTSGTSATTYGGNELVTASQYLTFVLKTLGYEAGKDFQWDKAWVLSDQIGLTTGKYDEYNPNLTRGDVALISLSAIQLQEVLADAPCFGLPADIRYVNYLETIEDLDNNILYSFLRGNYALRFKNMDLDKYGHRKIADTLLGRIDALASRYPELAGPFANVFVGCGTNMVMTHVDLPNATLTFEEVYQQQLAALKEAQAIKAKLHQKGAITEDMTQYQIAQVYYDYLVELNVKPGIGKRDPSCIEYDSAYAALIRKKADCVGRAAAFNLLMGVEGIPAQGVSGSFAGTGSGHVLSRVVLDGQEYFCDWGNRKPIGTYEDYEQKHNFIFKQETLEWARSAG